MKITLSCPYAWDRPGGVQSHVRSLARTLRDRGHEVSVLAPIWIAAARRDAQSELEGIRLDLTGRSVRVPANRSVAPIAFGPRGTVQVKRALDEFKPDVLHLHEPLIPSVSLLALWSFDGPMVGTFHAAASSNPLYKTLDPVLARAAAKLAVRTGVSGAAVEHVRRYFAGDYHLTPNGVEVARFADGAPARWGNGLKVLFLSRLERRKGLAILIRAMGLLKVEAELVVVGEGPERRRCEALAHRLNVAIRFLGRLSEPEKAAAFRRADVYCAPALEGESFGIVLIEAMASGTPVVCSGLPGFREAAGSAAVFVPPGHPVRLAEALRLVLADEQRRKEMGRTSQRRAGEFDWSRLVPQIEDHYTTALER